MPTKIALVGIGKIARDQHIPAIASSPDWALSAAVSRHGQIEGVDNFTDFSTMLSARPDIPVVSLCMPPVPRFDYACAAIAAGRHVMLEKPPGATLSEVHTLVSMAKSAGVSLFATWHSREAAAVAQAKLWLAEKTLVALKVTWMEDVRRWHPGQDWIWEAGGLGVFDPGINALSILTEILPVPIHLTSAELSFPQNRETPIAVSLKFAHPDNADVSAVFDWRQEGEQIWRMDIQTTTGDASLIEGGARLLVGGQEPLANETGPLGREYQQLYAKMSNLVALGDSEVDLRPMTHVADAFALGKRLAVAPFNF